MNEQDRAELRYKARKNLDKRMRKLYYKPNKRKKNFLDLIRQ